MAVDPGTCFGNESFSKPREGPLCSSDSTVLCEGWVAPLAERDVMILAVRNGGWDACACI